MRYLILIVFLITLGGCSSRKINGQYCNRIYGGFDVTCYTFDKTGRFTEKISGDLGTYYTGYGTYSLKDKILTLRYDKDSTISKSEFTISNWKFRDNEKTDSIDLIFKIYDGTSEVKPLLGATILEEAEEYKYNKENIVHQNGALTITKPQNFQTEKYKIFFVGFEMIEIPLKNDQTKEIRVKLYPAQPEVISDTIHTYKISKVEKDFFILGDDTKFKKSRK